MKDNPNPNPAVAHTYHLTSEVRIVPVKDLVKPCKLCGAPGKGLVDEVIVICGNCAARFYKIVNGWALPA